MGQICELSRMKFVMDYFDNNYLFKKGEICSIMREDRKFFYILVDLYFKTEYYPIPIKYLGDF